MARHDRSSDPASNRTRPTGKIPEGVGTRAAALLAIAVVVVVAAAAGSAGAAAVQADGNDSQPGANDSRPGAGDPQADANDSANESSGPTQLAPLNVTAVANDSSIALSGEGSTVTDPFALDDGLVVVQYHHGGDANFQLVLWNETADEPVAYPANRIGSVDGVAATGVSAGNYSLDVTANGPWNVTLVQPNSTALAAAGTAANASAAAANVSTAPANTSDAPANASAVSANATAVPVNETGLPATASGEGQAVLGPVDVSRSVTVTANHTGESNFQVTFWRENATSFLDSTLAFNEIGRLDAAETRVRHTGVSWIVVNADGEWELTVE